MKGGDASNVVYITNQSGQYYWREQVTGVRWTTNATDKTEYKITTANALTDTGASCISGPTREIEFLQNTILNAIIAEKGTVETSSSSWNY